MNSDEKWRYVTYRWDSQEKTVNINPIMLRFRPIAPKPVTGESGSGGVQFGNKNLLLCKPRAKRKYVRVRKNNIKRKKRSSSSSPSDHEESSKKTEKVVTLQLLPEKTEAIGSINDENGVVLEENNQDLPSLFNLNNSRRINRIAPLEEPDRKAVVSQTERATVVESWVTVECVTETCMDGRELGSTDVEKMKNLEADTCPGFISDGLNRVQWVNGAYKRMLMAGEGRGGWLPPEITAWLVIKQELPTFCTAFSCKVRLQFMWRNKCSTIMLPCDAWKMDGGGGFAWRLDVESALSLGH
ncbi:uncharacterized protein LOC105775015 [Gossypium raimondii]|uniref:DUF7950 domain-containing protein n=1 Tax=Gossypium raimondii TaxID=29730 RepID=A0A0D2UR70_GOSRA|nr:uncharacterized protein LOC105775015 [Gossypium raimondii]KJB70756.1 hypothetical protein B456_011G092600 [Gossypium raimondii]KJB70757.1 hypothetical protein B456_011G092600 [Gossypium raimondii]MBA0599422.1 hypothetical protein [Gossypium raimondii]